MSPHGDGPSHGTDHRWRVPTAEFRSEIARLESELTGLPEVSRAEVQMQASPVVGRQVRVELRSTRDDLASLRDLLDRALSLCWHTRAFVPDEVNAKVIGSEGTLVRPKDLGLELHAAGRADLYARYGPPAHDPHWSPDTTAE